MKDEKIDVKEIVDQEKGDVFNSGVMQALDDLEAWEDVRNALG